MNERIQSKLKSLTTKPGVYIMRDKNGEIIYIGKAKNLKNRVSQYFRNTDKPAKVQAMVNNIDDFDYFIAVSEADALALESNLIHKHKPFYNILLKDDKMFPYIKIDMKQDFPKLEIVRHVKKEDGAQYFGPYISIDSREILKIVTYAFNIRTCKQKIAANKMLKRECLNYSLGLCPAPCTGKITKDLYMKEIKRVIDFLNGNDEEIEQILQKKMEIASDIENFERAIELRDALKAMQKLKNRVVSNLPKDVDKDIFAYHTDGLSAVVTTMVVRGGKILGVANYPVDTAEFEENDILFNFITEYYSKMLIPNEIVVGRTIDENLLKAFVNKNIKIISHPRGINNTLLSMAQTNAEEYLSKQLEKEKILYNNGVGAIKQLKEKLNLKSVPYRMECYDISHISGTNKVASMVVFKNGRADKSQYRKFKIKSVVGNNDFASLKETLSRRLQRLVDQNGESFKEKPSLIVVDGGKGQLSSCYEILKEFKLENDIEIISLAKKLEEIFTTKSNVPVILKYGSVELKLLQRIRDESHRFAITFHRQLRTKAQTETELDQISGLGKTKIKNLLDAFKTTENIKNATIEELCSVKGIYKKLAIEIKKYFEK